MKEFLYSPSAPEPIGPYSQAVKYGELIFTSGQIPLDTNGNIIGVSIKEQTRQVLKNLKHVLEDNSSSIENVLKVTVYLKNMGDFPEMNEVYSEFFSSSLPARSTVEVSKLPKDVMVEMDVVAVAGKN